MSHMTVALCIIRMAMVLSIIAIHKEIFTFIVLLLSTGMCTHAQKVTLIKMGVQEGAKAFSKILLLLLLFRLVLSH